MKRQTLKKVMAILTAGMMILSAAGCGASDKAAGEKNVDVSETSVEEEGNLEENPVEEEQAEEDISVVKRVMKEQGIELPSDFGGYKIGFWYLPDSDKLSKEYRETLNYCAEITNCEMVYYDMSADFSVEAQTAAVESLVSQGCDGIIMIFGSSPAIFNYLNESGVYYVGFTRSYTDEVANVTDGSEYCTGWLDEGTDAGNKAMAYAMVDALAEAGCKKIVYIAGAPGNSLHDDHAEGFEAGAADNGIEIVANYRGSDGATGIADLLATYGNEIDGMALQGTGESGLAAIQAAGLTGKVKLAQTNSAGDNTRDYLEQGLLTATASANNVNIIQFYMQLFNALSGADRLFAEDYIVPVIPAMVVKSAEEWDICEECTTGDIPGLTPKEILSLNSIYDPNTTIAEKEALEEMYTNPDEFWNIEGISERVGQYLEK